MESIDIKQYGRYFYIKYIVIPLFILSLLSGYKVYFFVKDNFWNCESVSVSTVPFDKEINVYGVAWGSNALIPFSRDEQSSLWMNKTELYYDFAKNISKHLQIYGMSSAWVQKDNPYRNYSYSKIRISLPKPYIEGMKSVEINIGKTLFQFNKISFLKEWKKIDDDGTGYLYESPNNLSLKKSFFSYRSTVINWGGDFEFFKIIILKLLEISIVPIVIFSVILLLGVSRGFFTKHFDKVKYLFVDSEGAEKDYSYSIPTATGFLLLVSAIVLLETMSPYYFTQDDNFVEFLPTIIQGCRSFFNDGIFPTFNPFQYTGYPTTSLGMYSLTYPFTYAAYFIADTVLGNEYYTMEVFAVIHLVLGYFACVWLLGICRINPFITILGSLSFVLSGFSLIAGRSWYTTLPLILWLPLLLISILFLQKKKITWKWGLYTGMAIGIFFHMGAFQAWLYAILFCCLSIFILLITNSISKRKTLYIIPASFLGGAIAAPLFYQMFLASRNLMGRQGNAQGGIIKGMLAMLFPYPIAEAPHPNEWINVNRELAGQLYYTCSLFPAIWWYAIIIIGTGIFIYRKNDDFIKKIISDNIWILLGFIAFLFALGDYGLLWTGFSVFPVLKAFSSAFKFLPYMNLYIILGAGLIIERYLINKKPGKHIKAAIYFIAIILLFYHVLLCNTSFYTYADKPYPVLPENVYRLLSADKNEKPQRIYVSAPLRSPDTGYAFSLHHNFPTIYNIPSILGYDTFVSKKPVMPTDIYYRFKINREILYNYGVKYILRLDASTDLFPGETPFPDTNEVNLKKILQFDKVDLYEIDDYLPLSFLQSDPASSYPVKFTGRGVVVDTSTLPKSSDVVVNLIYRKGMTATANGKQLKISPDTWDRIVVLNCPSVKNLEIRYKPQWIQGFLIAAGMLIISIMSFLFLTKKEY